MSPGRLVLVATPIGNLGDVSARAVDVLAEARRICCEDTRRTRILLTALGIPSGRRLVAVHAHNEESRSEQVVDWLGAGELVAVVTDAGTPAISDPGERLVRAAVDAGFEVSTVPGPSAALAALVVSGLPTDRFSFEGFLPRKGRERRRRIEELGRATGTSLLLESPVRLGDTLADLYEVMGERPVAVARELTKLHEEVWRGDLGDAVNEFRANPRKGEVVIVVGADVGSSDEGRRADEVSDEAVHIAVSEALEKGLSVRDAAREVASSLHVPHRRAYQVALLSTGTMRP